MGVSSFLPRDVAVKSLAQAVVPHLKASLAGVCIQADARSNWQSLVPSHVGFCLGLPYDMAPGFPRGSKPGEANKSNQDGGRRCLITQS